MAIFGAVLTYLALVVLAGKGILALIGLSKFMDSAGLLSLFTFFFGVMFASIGNAKEKARQRELEYEKYRQQREAEYRKERLSKSTAPKYETPSSKPTLYYRAVLGKEYSYDNVKLARPPAAGCSNDFDLLLYGESVDIEQEPDNEYDDRAVAVMHLGDKIGYIYRGRLQDMINDFIDRGDDVEATISSADESGVFINIVLTKYR